MTPPTITTKVMADMNGDFYVRVYVNEVLCFRSMSFKIQKRAEEYAQNFENALKPK